jgi:hypothetical protein
MIWMTLSTIEVNIFNIFFPYLFKPQILLQIHLPLAHDIHFLIIENSLTCRLLHDNLKSEPI